MSPVLFKGLRSALRLCWLLGHAERRGMTRLEGFSERSNCMFCKRDLIRAPDGRWLVADRERAYPRW